jgi:hypothetical protein
MSDIVKTFAGPVARVYACTHVCIVIFRSYVQFGFIIIRCERNSVDRLSSNHPSIQAHMYIYIQYRTCMSVIGNSCNNNKKKSNPYSERENKINFHSEYQLSSKKV